jgi:hypothetical protein
MVRRIVQISHAVAGLLFLLPLSRGLKSWSGPTESAELGRVRLGGPRSTSRYKRTTQTKERAPGPARLVQSGYIQ